ncbi:MAG TPA: hypothetical protein VM241_00560 [Candidatus Thermoplasmatota archaeon]|nr:hypothetical protein [Candidatus Thermoplasmatota archaeon]
MAPAKKTTRKSAKKSAKKGKRKATPKQLAALKKARKMKEVRARAKSSPGGKGPIRNRPAAVRLLGPPK